MAKETKLRAVPTPGVPGDEERAAIGSIGKREFLDRYTSLAKNFSVDPGNLTKFARVGD